MTKFALASTLGSAVLAVLVGCGGPTGPGTAPDACSVAADCEPFSCACRDGTVWGSAQLCQNNVCQGEAATCESSCRARGGTSSSSSGAGGGAGGGSSSGAGGGGTTSGTYCSVATTCPAYSCSCRDGTFWNTSRYCFNNVCQGAGPTCTNSCKDRGGVGTGGGGGGQSFATVYACKLTKYSSENAVTVVLHGSGAARATALSGALAQCADADWASWFCSSAAESCVTEPAAPTSCTFSKYSSEFASTIRFYGSGGGEGAARAAAVDACLASGKWKGWFCTSGSFTCTRD